MHGPVEITLSGGSEVEVGEKKIEMKLHFELAGEMKADGRVER